VSRENVFIKVAVMCSEITILNQSSDEKKRWSW
jgi:hypothetical protein